MLGKELEAGQWTDRLYVISELAVGNSVILNDALIYIHCDTSLRPTARRCQRGHQLALHQLF